MPDTLPLSTEALLRQRYPEGDAPAGLPLNDTLRVLLDHRSCRNFAPTPLAPEVLGTLIGAAQSAPTSSNLQSWSVVAVQDPARKSRLATLAADQAFIRAAPLFLCFVADLSRLDRLGKAQGQELEGLRYLESFVIAAIDAALAAQNVVVAAESLGLGTVYVGAARNRPAEFAAELALPPEAAVVFGLAVGHPDPAVGSGIKPRLPASLVLHHETYGATDEAAGIARYDAAMRRFSRDQGMRETGWISRVLSRVASGASLSGRDRLKEILSGLGFGLR
jgi:nitroreductase